MKYKARFTVEHEKAFDAENIEMAENLMRLNKGIKLLGIIPADQAWPDAAEPTKRPPRNKPPGGSPGTPTLDAQPELSQAVAA